MFRWKPLTASLIAMGGLGAGAWAAYNPDKPDPAIVAGLYPAVCRPPVAGGPDTKVFLKLVAAKNELQPLGRLPAGPATGPAATEPVPLWDNLGTLSYRISTANPQAQKYFDQGLRLAYAFNHAEAARAFRAAQRLDPACAMCWWGEALVLGPNINAPMDPAAAPPAVAAVRQAQALKANASPREQALIDALAKRYSDEPAAKRAELDQAYAQAMGQVAQRYPGDNHIAVLYAESLMDLQPWDYWEAGGARPKGRAGEIVATLERVLKNDPQHPGAIHYYIHMVEASNNPKRAEPYADRLGRLMPGAGHLVHMPAHIYYRVGRYKDSLRANLDAVRADEAYFSKVNASGIYRDGYYPHNVHFVLVSAQMAGDGATVIEAARKLDAIVSVDSARAIPWVQPIKAAPYFAHAQFSRPATILALPDPGDALPYVKAMWHYARGVAHAAAGNLDAARAEAQAIDAMAARHDFADLVAGGVPAKEVLQIARHVVTGRIAQASGDLDRAVDQFGAAVALQDQLAYMEPPFWYYPVRQSLGAALLMKGDLDGAEQAFRASLAGAPNNSWSLYGLRQVYQRRGDARATAAVDKLLQRAWAGKPQRPALAGL